MRWFKRLMLLLILLALGVVVFGLVIHESRPTAEPTAQADALARKAQAAINMNAWTAIEAIHWNFAGRQTHLWDKKRGLIRVRWDDIEVLRPLDRADGVVTVGGTTPDAQTQATLLKKAYAHWANDAFWLNPIAKLFDEGVTRSIVHSDGKPALLVAYSSGGVTPGDAYLWHLDDAGRPTAWQMWVSNIPIGGLKASWDAWTTVAGAQISTAHTLGPVTLRLTDVRGGALSTVEPGPDPFAALLSR